MEKNTLVLIGVLAAMVLIAGVQFFQFNALTNNLGNLKVSGTVAPVASSPTPISSGSGRGNLPSTLSNLPSQVGGC